MGIFFWGMREYDWDMMISDISDKYDISDIYIYSQRRRREKKKHCGNIVSRANKDRKSVHSATANPLSTSQAHQSSSIRQVGRWDIDREACRSQCHPKRRTNCKCNTWMRLNFKQSCLNVKTLTFFPGAEFLFDAMTQKVRNLMIEQQCHHYQILALNHCLIFKGWAP